MQVESGRTGTLERRPITSFWITYPSSRFYGHLPRALTDLNGSAGAMTCLLHLRVAERHIGC